jgi:hypothetical protein
MIAEKLGRKFINLLRTKWRKIMGKVGYFLVAYDYDDKGFFIDNDSLDACFPDGVIWNRETGKWGYEDEDEIVEQMGWELQQALYKLNLKFKLDGRKKNG